MCASWCHRYTSASRSLTWSVHLLTSDMMKQYQTGVSLPTVQYQNGYLLGLALQRFRISCHILSISLRPSPWSPSHSGATPFTMYRVSTEWFVQPAIWYWCTVPSTLNNSTCIRAYHLGTSMHTNISPTSTQSRPFSLNNKRLSRNHSWVLDVFTLVSDTGAIIYIYIYTYMVLYGMSLGVTWCYIWVNTSWLAVVIYVFPSANAYKGFPLKTFVKLWICSYEGPS